MNYELYDFVVVGEDEVTAERAVKRIVVTQENNCILVWDEDDDYTPEVLKQYQRHEKSQAIEWAIDYGRPLRKKLVPIH